jgi:hypothetical protein
MSFMLATLLDFQLGWAEEEAPFLRFLPPVMRTSPFSNATAELGSIPRLPKVVELQGGILLLHGQKAPFIVTEMS